MPNFMKNIFSILSSPFGVKESKPNNAGIVGRGERFSGEVSQDLPLFRYYEYYFGWPEVKDGLNSIHSRWMGIRQEIRSPDETFQKMCNMWVKVVGFWPKLSQFALDSLISGAGIMELQFDGTLLANVAHIPTKTIWKIYRDKHGNVREYVQMLNGEAIILSPKYIMQYNINNPDEESLGHSEIFSIATPQKISGQRDEFGNSINPDRYIPSVLDVNARLKFAHMETLEKHAKSQIFVTVEDEHDRIRQEAIEKELNNHNSDKWLHVTDKKVTTAEAAVNPKAPFTEHSIEMEKSVDRATGFPGKTMNEGGSMGFASSQTPVQEMANRIANKQNDLNNLVVDSVFQLLAEQWGFDWEKVRPEIVFVPFKEPLTFDQIMQLEQSTRISDSEFRDMLRHHVPDLNDKEFEKFKKEQEKMQAELQKIGNPTKPNDPKNPRPDIEKNAERPPQTNSLEYFMKNPKALENYIRGVVASNENSGFTLPMQESDSIVELPAPEVTDPKVAKRLAELHNNLSSSKEAVERAGFGGFATLQGCIDANTQESDPKGYCLIEYGKATQKLIEAKSELEDFLINIKANDLNDEMFRGDAHHQSKNENSAVVSLKSNEITKKEKDESKSKSYETLFTNTSGEDPIK